MKKNYRARIGPMMKSKQRPTEPHSSYCKYCPSKRGGDPESEMIAALPDGEKQKYVFSCAWRPNKLCRGVCENLNYDENKHAHLLQKAEAH